jgi:cytidylate kinase
MNPNTPSTIDLSPFPNNIAKVLEYKSFDISKFQMDNSKRIIRISGIAGSGKGTISKKLSQLLDIGHLETSTILRAATFIYKTMGLEHTNENTENVFGQISLRYDEKELQIFWREQLLTNLELRSNIVQQNVAVLAGDSYFRSCYYDKVCWLIENCIHESVILDGRGFNTPYLKMAENLGFEVIKLFFWVSEEANYERYRTAYIGRNDIDESLLESDSKLETTIKTEFQKNMIDRNYQDYLNDLKNNLESITSDSSVVNTSELSPDQVLELVLSLI